MIGKQRILSWGTALFLFFFVLPLSAHSTTLITKDGKTFSGKVLQEDADSILLEIEDGVQVTIGKEQIEHTQNNGDPEPVFQFKTDYPLLGVTLLFPTGVNLVGGYYGKDLGAKLSGGFWGSDAWGVQLNLSKKIGETKDILHNLSLVFGARQSDPHWNPYYAGLGYDVNVKGFACELDILNGRDITTGALVPRMALQVGFAHRFN